MPRIEWLSFLFLLCFSTSIKAMNEIFGSMGEPLVLPCGIDINVNITKRVELNLVDDTEYMYGDFRNSTGTFHCIRNHPKSKKCRVDLSSINGSLVNFALNPWSDLDGRQYWCLVRHIKSIEDKPGPKITIGLEGKKESETVGPTTTPTPVVTPDHNNSCPNSTNTPNDTGKEDDGKHSTATLVGSILGAFLVAALIGALCVGFVCKRRFRNPSASERLGNNVNIPLQELNGQTRKEESET